MTDQISDLSLPRRKIIVVVWVNSGPRMEQGPGMEPMGSNSTIHKAAGRAILGFAWYNS